MQTAGAVGTPNGATARNCFQCRNIAYDYTFTCCLLLPTAPDHLAREKRRVCPKSEVQGQGSVPRPTLEDFELWTLEIGLSSQFSNVGQSNVFAIE